MVSQQVYNQHAFQNRGLRAFLTNSTSYVFDLPICPKCETVGLRTYGWREKQKTMKCPKCGYEGPSTKTYGEFIAEALYE